MDAKTLRLIRQTIGLSQRQLAKKAGVSKALVNFIESGQRAMTPSVKRRLLDVLGVTDEQIARYEQLATDLLAI